MIVTSPPQLKYDERNHIGLAHLVAKDGWRDALTSPENPSAAGPFVSRNSPGHIADHALASAGDSLGKFCLFCGRRFVACQLQTNGVGRSAHTVGIDAVSGAVPLASCRHGAYRTARITVLYLFCSIISEGD